MGALSSTAFFGFLGTMRICKKLEWLRPYVKQGLKHVSKEVKLARVGAWAIGKSRGRGEFAALVQRKRGDPFRIWLHTHYLDSENKPRPFSKIDLLRNLAHEIAHLADWNHTPKHAKIESRINIAFMRMLKSEGYISEEHEFKGNP
jgi:hypothetical protein